MPDYQVAFPYHLDKRGLTATSDLEEHIEDMLEQLLFTRPGERVNRPDFGCGLLGTVFGPNSPAIGAALEVTIGAAVQQWLGDEIQIGTLTVTSAESTIEVTISYTIRATGAVAAAAVSIPAGR